MVLLLILAIIIVLNSKYYNLHVTSKKIKDSPAKKRLIYQSVVYSFAIFFRAVFNIIAHIKNDNSYDEINA
jgi:hypothetical protein